MARSPRKPEPEAATAPPTTAPPAAPPQSLVDRIVGASKNTSVIVAAIAGVLALLVALTTQIPTLWKLASGLFESKPPVVEPIDIAGDWCVLNTVRDAGNAATVSDGNVFKLTFTRVAGTPMFTGHGSKIAANGSRTGHPGSELTLNQWSAAEPGMRIPFDEQVYKLNGTLAPNKYSGTFDWTYSDGRFGGQYNMVPNFQGVSEAERWASDNCQAFVLKSIKTVPPA
jgi:hypothetical protein